MRKSIALILLLMLLLTSCSRFRYNPKADQSFLTDQPCSAPCWHGLVPGVSTKAEVLATLEELAFIDQNSIKEYGTRWKGDDAAQSIRFNCRYPSGKYCGSAVISKDELKRLGLPIYIPLTFEDIANKLGQPEYLDYGVYPPAVCIVHLTWPDQGILAGYNKGNIKLCQEISDYQGLPSEILVDILIYVIPNSLEIEPGAGAQRIEWPGFSNE